MRAPDDDTVGVLSVAEALADAGALITAIMVVAASVIDVFIFTSKLPKKLANHRRPKSE